MSERMGELYDRWSQDLDGAMRRIAELEDQVSALSRGRNLPRDRWIGASPDGNVTPAGQALEALAAVRDRCERVPQHGGTDAAYRLALELLQIIDSIMRTP